jgi:DNA-binding NarL/FixJ family response regulator
VKHAAARRGCCSEPVGACQPVKARIPQSMPEALNSRLRRIDKGSAAPTRSADATLPGPPVRRQRLVAARRTAGLSRAEREARIVSLLNRGVAIAEIAAREGLSLKRMRNLVREIFAQRMPQSPAES